MNGCQKSINNHLKPIKSFFSQLDLSMQAIKGPTKSGVTVPLSHVTRFITINQAVDYMARGLMILMRGLDITRTIGRVALKVDEFNEFLLKWEKSSCSYFYKK